MITVDTIQRAVQEKPVKRVRIRLDSGNTVKEHWLSQEEIKQLREQL